MKIKREEHPVFFIQTKNIIKIRDPIVLAIYVFIQSQMALGEYAESLIIDNMKNHFHDITHEQIMYALEIIIEDLELIQRE